MNQDWEKEFDKQFGIIGLNGVTYIDHLETLVPEVKSFISQELEKAREGGRQEGEKKLSETAYIAVESAQMKRTEDRIRAEERSRILKLIEESGTSGDISCGHEWVTIAPPLHRCRKCYLERYF